MGRILFFLLLALVGWYLFKSWQRKSLQDDESGELSAKQQNAKVGSEKESIYPCKHCGAYSPLSSGVMVEGRFYCNLSHAKAQGEKVQ